MRRIGLALLGALFHTIACALLWYGGLFRTSLEGFILLFTVIWIVDLSFPVMILTGLNQYFKEQSLTLPMVLWSQIVVMFCLYFVDEYRPVMLLFSVLGMAFGAYRLNNKQSIFVAFFSMGLYLIVLLVLDKNHPSLLDPIPEWTVGFSYACISICTVIVTSELSAMRRRLAKKALELENSLSMMQLDAYTDPITGLKNRHYILDILQEQKNLTERELSYRFSIAIFKIDNFKYIHETHGSFIGDKVLKFFTTQIEFQLRKTDCFARLDDGEFLLVCPFTELEKCRALVERICTVFSNVSLDGILPNLKITVYVGVADYQSPEKLDALLNRAAQNLSKTS